MWLPDASSAARRPRASLALICLALSACGGGDKLQTSQQLNPAAGLYSAADNDANPASVLITPDGQFAAVVASRVDPSRLISASAAAGQLTSLVFVSSSLVTHDLSTGAARSGTLTVNYRQAASMNAQLDYIVEVRKIAGDYLADSFAAPASSTLPSSASATLYLPRAGASHVSLASSWSLSFPDLKVTAPSADCALSGTLAPDSSVNAFIVTVSPTEGCGVGTNALSGYLWLDGPRGYAHALLRPATQPYAAPALISVKL